MALNLNNADITNWYTVERNNLTQLSTTTIDDITQQKATEMALLKQFNFCPVRYQIETHIKELNPQKLKEMLDNKFINKNVLDFTACIADSIFIAHNDDNNLMTERIKRYINNVKQIGSPSVMGYALLGNLNNNSIDINSPALFVLKSPRNIANADELIHEAIVGFLGTNRLRTYIPNFAYIYALFDCSAPILYGQNVANWCTSNGVYYVVYEAINNAISTTDYIKSPECTAKNLLNYYIQFCLAIKFASSQIGFTHNDAHYDNVLLRRLRGNRQIRYPWDNNNIYFVTTNAIPTLIDYGQSHITYNNINLGMVSHPLPGNSRDKTLPIRDVYKYLGFILYDARQYNFPVYTSLKELLSYFFDLPNNFQRNNIIDNIVNTQRNTFYTLPDDNRTNKFNLDNFIEFLNNFSINSGWGTVVENIENKNIALIATDDFDTVSLKANMALSNKINPPDDIIMLYDTLYALHEQKDLEEVENIQNASISHIPNYLEIEKKNANNLVSHINNFDINKVINIQNWNFDQFEVYIFNFTNPKFFPDKCDADYVIDYLDSRKTVLKMITIIQTLIDHVSDQFIAVQNIYNNINLRNNVYILLKSGIEISLSVFVPETYSATKQPLPELVTYRQNHPVKYKIISEKLLYLNSLL